VELELETSSVFVFVVVVKITNVEAEQQTGARKYGVLVVLVYWKRLRLFTQVQGAVSDFEAVMLPWK
jgi:hypothetical protein